MPVMQSSEASAALEAAKRAFAIETMESLAEGIAHLERAAALGNSEALTQLAHFVGSGVNQPADWDKSADILKEAAERGSALARDELRLLAGGAGGAPGALRARVDMRAAIAPRQTESVSETPRIRASRGFLSSAECQWLITRGRGRLTPATVYKQAAEGAVRVEERTNSAAPFRLFDVDLPQVLIMARMAATVGLPSHWFEPAMLLHYKPGQQFAPHHDFLDSSVPGYAGDLARRGQRIATLLTYLNEDYEGGETAFPEISYYFKGRTGDLLVFANTLPSGAPDPKSLHAGLPPTRGEKWLLSQWVRDRPLSSTF
jgi:predicted 2-oxoglutarate/Fe(II)-dependent dioxygenase YbiX